MHQREGALGELVRKPEYLPRNKAYSLKDTFRRHARVISKDQGHGHIKCHRPNV
jgi:hypothetical protein